MRKNLTAVLIFLMTGLVSGCDLSSVPAYTVIIDPGHGGAPINRRDDKWDPVTRTFLNRYYYGMKHGKHEEHKVMLSLSRKVHSLLKLTETEEGWKQFEAILRKYTNQKEIKRIQLTSVMTRDDGWDDRDLEADHPDVNVPYRLYDFPGREDPRKMKPGRISYINSLRPELVVSLHMNPAGKGNPGGMAAVLSPGYKTFDHIRKIHMGKAPESDFDKMLWSDYWLINEPGWSRFQMARADTWVYFHGFRTNKEGTAPWIEKNRGIRQNLITWAYRDDPDWIEKARKQLPGPYTRNYKEFKAEGKYWDRERSQEEFWRREAAVEGTQIKVGGDNHYASDQLMRYVLYGLRSKNPELRKKGALGDIVNPFVSTYSLPTFVNAVVAYLEIGHLDVARDRNMIFNYQDHVAESLAVGIYALFAPFEPRADYKGPFKPSGKPLDFKKYGDYFDEVVD